MPLNYLNTVVTSNHAIKLGGKGEGNLLIFNNDISNSIYIGADWGIQSSNGDVVPIGPQGSIAVDGSLDTFAICAPGQTAQVLVVPGGQNFFQLIEIITKALVLNSTGTGSSGLFVYSGTGALGNPPVAFLIPPGITQDPFGNALTPTSATNPEFVFGGSATSGRAVIRSAGAGLAPAFYLPSGQAYESEPVSLFEQVGTVGATHVLEAVLTGPQTAALGGGGVSGIAGTVREEYYSAYADGSAEAGWANVFFDKGTGTRTVLIGTGNESTEPNKAGDFIGLVTASHPGTFPPVRETWQTPTLTGFNNNIGNTPVLKYWLRPDGDVAIEGVMQSIGAYTLGTTIWTMPAGYRPATNPGFCPLIINGAGGPTPGWLIITTAGLVQCQQNIAATTGVVVSGSYRLAV